MPNFKSFTTLSLVTFACLAVYANTPSDDLAIALQKEKATQVAVLTIITNFILIPPTNTPATFDGDTTGQVTEDTALTTTGTLDVTDLDENQESMQVRTYAGTFGSLVMDAVGEWAYTLDNTNATVQGLDDGEMVTDLVTVLSLDGTAQIITLTVNGQNEVIADQPTVFNLTTFDGPPGTKGLEGTITDDDGITSIKIEYKNTTGTVIYTSNYTDGDIDNEPVSTMGTTYTITVTDDNNVVKTKTGTL
jgi:VCBS repeat-containing protein